MQGIYTYIPETNHVPREYIVAAIVSSLLLLLLLSSERDSEQKCVTTRGGIEHVSM
jgi:hypothetical protein